MNEHRQDNGRVVLVAGGDVMLGEHPLMVGWGLSSRLRREPGLYPFAHITEELRSADISIANLECSLSSHRLGRSPSARECIGRAESAVLLRDAGLSIVSVANNHTMQHGRKVFQESLEHLAAAGLQIVGLANEGDPRSCQPLDLNVKGTRFRFLAYSLRPRQYFDDQPPYAEPTTASLLADVAGGRRAGRTVVVSLHWGDEFIRRPSPDQISLGRQIVDAGAALVLGHHPHVLQGWERRGDSLIAYSLGNLVFDMTWESRLRRSAMLQCEFVDGNVKESTWLPITIGDDWSPRPADAESAGGILEELAAGVLAIAKHQDTPPSTAQLAAYRAEVAHELALHRKASHRHFGRNLHRYEPRVLLTILGKAVRRRIGLLED